MKKNTYILFTIVLFLLFFVFTATKAFAKITPTPTDSLQQQVNDLKSRIASRVAELKLVEKKGILGTVTDASDTQITLSDLNGNLRYVDVDELTKFSSPSTKSFGISDIKKGDTLGVLGLYNKQSRRILARQVNIQSPLQKIIYGAVLLVDKTNFEITIAEESGQKTVAEIADVTKTYSYSLGTLAKSGFSKIHEVETVMIIGTLNKQDPNKISASRIILFPDVQVSSKINLTPSANPTIPPSTGSGVKLYPIKK